MRKAISLSALMSRYRGVMMGICALMILFFHDWVITVSEFPVIGAIEGFLKTRGYYGVDVFFLLSGMGLSYAMRKETSVRRFYLRRLRRVYVPFLEVLLLKALLEKWSLGTILARALCVEVFSRGIYSFLWFVPVILWLYLLYPLLHRMLDGSRNDDVLLAGMIGCVFLLEGVCIARVHTDYHGLLFRFPTFLIGVWIGRRSQKKPITCTAWQYALLLTALAAAYIACGYLRRAKGVVIMEGVQLTAFALLFAFAVGGVCAWIDAQKCRIMRLGQWGIRLLALCGTFTLELYAVQEFYWFAAGPLEGRMTYLQTNLLCMLLFPLAAYLLSRVNRAILYRGEAGAANPN